MNLMKTTSKMISACLCAIIFFSTTFSTLGEYYIVHQTTKDTAVDFDNFLERCSLAERIVLLQSLRGIKIKIKDDYFGKLKNLPQLSYYAKSKNEASQTKPLRPKTFNEVSSDTVLDAIEYGYIDKELFSPQKIKRELVWRRYNKVNFALHKKKYIDYHHDYVMWIAKKNDVPNYKFLATYELEKKIALKYFEKIWDKLDIKQREELLNRIEIETGSEIKDKAALALQGGAVAIAALSGTVAFMGFAFYTTMSTVICTVAAWFGVTLPFAAYTGAATTVAVLTGPIGWCLAGLGAIGSAFLMGMSEPDTIAAFIITVNSIKAKWEKDDGR